MILALAGGVGGAKLANGLAQRLAPQDLVVVVNTGDDFSHLGLRIAPDLDTVMYTLAGRSNTATGWGLAGETWQFMDALARLDGETWFRLGDRDLATHVERTRRLNAGETLSAVTAELCRAYGVAHPVVPMSDDPVQTVVHTDAGPLAFQDYFVRRRCAPAVRALQFAGAEAAAPSPGFRAALADARLRAIVLCPSNPYLSIHPILALAGVRAMIATRGVPTVAVSPIIGNAAVKGPAAKIMRELGHTVSAATIARLYAGLVDGLVIDERDRPVRAEIEAAGLRVCVTDALMKGPQDQARLAQTTLEFAASIAPARAKRVAA
jgi:LPPG:FO 2-phospho-L-lactate transferase